MTFMQCWYRFFEADRHWDGLCFYLRGRKKLCYHFLFFSFALNIVLKLCCSWFDIHFQFFYLIKEYNNNKQYSDSEKMYSENNTNSFRFYDQISWKFRWGKSIPIKVVSFKYVAENVLSVTWRFTTPSLVVKFLSAMHRFVFKTDLFSTSCIFMFDAVSFFHYAFYKLNERYQLQIL